MSHVTHVSHMSHVTHVCRIWVMSRRRLLYTLLIWVMSHMYHVYQSRHLSILHACFLQFSCLLYHLLMSVMWHTSVTWHTCVAYPWPPRLTATLRKAEGQKRGKGCREKAKRQGQERTSARLRESERQGAEKRDGARDLEKERGSERQVCVCVTYTKRIHTYT